MKTTPYSRGFTPPVPVLSVSLTLPYEASRFGPYLALIDTGADGTFVPTPLLEEVGASVMYMTNVRSYLGDKVRRVSVHSIDLILSDVDRLPNVEVVSDDWGDQIILGRNVLNQLRLLLDGPKMTTSVLK